MFSFLSCLFSLNKSTLPTSNDYLYIFSRGSMCCAILCNRSASVNPVKSKEPIDDVDIVGVPGGVIVGVGDGGDGIVTLSGAAIITIFGVVIFLETLGDGEPVRPVSACKIDWLNIFVFPLDFITEVNVLGGDVVVVVVVCFGITVVGVLDLDEGIFFGTLAASIFGPPILGCKNDLFPRVLRFGSGIPFRALSLNSATTSGKCFSTNKCVSFLKKNGSLISNLGL